MDAWDTDVFDRGRCTPVHFSFRLRITVAVTSGANSFSVGCLSICIDNSKEEQFAVKLKAFLFWDVSQYA